MIVNSNASKIFPKAFFTEEESRFLFSKLRPSSIDKGEFLLKADDEVDEIFYIRSGCLRSYFIDMNGKEHILQFAVEGWWISDYIALYGGKKIPSVSI